ncbi:hypothetical protein BG004_005543 [Podila humilis]|nr:hypothetical protein BG004_005543 [Podila humilis]
MSGPVLAMPQPMIMAPESEYAYYDEVAPGGVAGYGTYSVASIYENENQSVISIYENENRTVASIYDDRTNASIFELENQPMGVGVYGLGYGPGYGVGYGAGYGQTYGRHMVSAAHIEVPSDVPTGQQHHCEMRCDSEEYIDNRHVQHKSPPRDTCIDLEGVSRQQSPTQRTLDQQRFYHESAAYAEYRGEPERQLSPKHIEWAERFDRGANVYRDNQPVIGQMSPGRIDNSDERRSYFHSDDHQKPRREARKPQGGAETSLEILVNRHVSRPAGLTSQEAEESELYQEMKLDENTGQIQELALETYYDTTKSQLKARERQGNVLAAKVFQLHRHQNDSAPNSLTPSLRRPEARSPPPTNQPPPTLTIPKPPANPPPVRLLANRGVNSSPKPILSVASHTKMHRMASSSNRISPSGGNGQRKTSDDDSRNDDDENQTPVLSTSISKTETIMLQARHQPSQPDLPSIATAVPDNTAKATKKARTLISGANESSRVEGFDSQTQEGVPFTSQGLPSTSVAGATGTRQSSQQVPPAMNGGHKKRRKEHLPPMSRHHLHPSGLNEGVWACWNNEFAAALKIFSENATMYPRWCLAAAEVHIVRQLISGQLSEADSDLLDALQLSEKVSSRISDKKQEFESSYMGYRSLCAADASLIAVNENTLRQNYKWDCDMAFYDTLLYRGILQVTSASDTKGTFTDIKGGWQLRRARKGYMRIKQEMELAKEKWQKLVALNATAASTQSANTEDKKNTSLQIGSKDKSPLAQNQQRDKTSSTSTVPIEISGRPTNAPPPVKRSSMMSTSQLSDGSRWSLFGRRASWNQSSASLSSSPVVGGEQMVVAESSGGDDRRSRFLTGTSPPPVKGLASALREQAKAAEDFKNAVKVLEDTEDCLHYGIGLFYFIVSIVPKSLVPALRTFGLQSNHDEGIKNFEQVLTRKNGRAPFAALFLLVNYLFLPRGMQDPSVSLGRAGVILNESLRRCPNGSSYLLMACHHARKIGNMIPSAMNHITRGIQTCEAAGIPSINYRFELGLTFFINQEFGKAADIFEILWRKYITALPDRQNQIQDSDSGFERGGYRKKNQSQSPILSGIQPHALPNDLSSHMSEEDEEDDFELAPFCGLCLIASRVVVRMGQEGYFEYGREGFGRHAAASPGGVRGGAGTPNSMEGVAPSANGLGRVGPDFDLLIAAQEVLAMMSAPPVETTPMQSQPLSRASTFLFEHVKAGSNQSLKYVRDLAQGQGASGDIGTDSGTISGITNPLMATAPVPAQGKLNRFNKFAWNQCQKSIQKGRITPFLPLVILYLRRDLAYMKPVLLRKFRSLLESIWKTVPQPVDADTQATYLLLSAVVHRQLLPDDGTFAYTALTDCLLLESMIETELWVVPYCHYELGELLYKKLQLPQAAIEQFQWVIKGPSKEARPASVYVSTVAASTSDPRLSVFGGGFPSDTITQLVDGVGQQEATTSSANHNQHHSSASQHRLSQFFPNTTTAPASANPPNPMSFYNSRYKKFEFSQALRHRSTICVEQIQKAIKTAASLADGSVGTCSSGDSDPLTGAPDIGMTPKKGKQASVLLSDKITEAVSQPMGFDPPLGSLEDSTRLVQVTGASVSQTTRKENIDPPQREQGQVLQEEYRKTTSPQVPTSYQTHFQNLKGWSASTLPNILTDAQRRRGSQQWLAAGSSAPIASNTAAAATVVSTAPLKVLKAKRGEANQ